VIVQTVKDATGKYGRYIAEVETLGGANLNDALVANGHARYRDY
jgi:endonuclease YncB( thermonuclease family)